MYVWKDAENKRLEFESPFLISDPLIHIEWKKFRMMFFPAIFNIHSQTFWISLFLMMSQAGSSIFGSYMPVDKSKTFERS